MNGSIFDEAGRRKYLNGKERKSFLSAAVRQQHATATFCLTLALSGARISEVLALTRDRIDKGSSAVVFRTLKQREKVVYRTVPMPQQLIKLLHDSCTLENERIWKWGRTTAWKQVKSVMVVAGIPSQLRKPKALRHAFAIEATQKLIPLNIIQRWMGHSRLETTAIYTAAVGREERNLASRTWPEGKLLQPFGSDHTLRA